MEVFYVNATTCALCKYYFEAENSDPDYPGPDCLACPLYAVRGTPCDRKMKGEDHSPWSVYNYEVDPLPMIELLQEALDSKDKA